MALLIAIGSVVGTRLAVTRVGTKAVVFTGLLMLTAAFAWVATVGIDVPYLQVAAQMVLLGGGLGLTTAPATDSIMGVVRPEQAGAGSAVNDATRQVGGTLGVAVVGSIFSTLYIQHLSDSAILRAAPESAQATARQGLAQGLQVAATIRLDRRNAPQHGQRRVHFRPARRVPDRLRRVPGRGTVRPGLPARAPNESRSGMKDPQRYGPWALITGASDGIGKALAEKIAAAGINVMLVARGEDRLRALASELQTGDGVDTAVIGADLADPGALDRIEDLTRQIDIGLVVLAAGFGTTGMVLETVLADELALIAVNITAVTRLAHTFAARLAARTAAASCCSVPSSVGRESPGRRTTRHRRLTSRAWPKDCMTNSPRGELTCCRSRLGPSPPVSAPEQGSQ